MKSNMGNEMRYSKHSLNHGMLQMRAVDGLRNQLESVHGMIIGSPCPSILAEGGCSQARWNAMVKFYINNNGIVT